MDKITQSNNRWGCVKGKVAKVALEKWATLERGKGTIVTSNFDA